MSRITSTNTNVLVNGSKEKNFLCEYEFENSCYCITIPASSLEEAKAKLVQVSQGKVVGELKAVIPVQLGWFAKAITRIQNFLKD